MCNNSILENSICIFTDASLVKINGKFIVSSGCKVYDNGILIFEDHFLQYDSTVNRGELYAILMGINSIYNYNNIKPIRLFSDSQTSIFAIRDRIFNWINNSNNTLIGSDRKPIANTDIIMEIIYSIINNNINIELYHVKGHVNINNKNDLYNAQNVFFKSNNILLDLGDIINISKYNNEIDIYSRRMIDRKFSTINNNVLLFEYDNLDVELYKSLINKKGDIHE